MKCISWAETFLEGQVCRKTNSQIGPEFFKQIKSCLGRPDGGSHRRPETAPQGAGVGQFSPTRGPGVSGILCKRV